VSVYYKNTRRVLSYDVLRQQKTWVMTKGVVSGGVDLLSGVQRRARHKHFVVLCEQRTTDTAVCSTLAAVRRCFSQLATRAVDNPIDLYAAKPDIRPESRFCLPHLHSTPPLGGSRRNIATPFGMEKLEWCGYPMVKKFRRLQILKNCNYFFK